MISLPKDSSLCDGCMREEWIIIDWCWMLYLSPALTILPAFANSKLFLWAVFVRLTVLCARKELANETWRGRQSSESVSEMLEWQDSSMKDISVMPFPSTDVTEASVLFWKMAAAMKNTRYFSRFFISGDKYRQIWCKPIFFIVIW